MMRRFMQILTLSLAVLFLTQPAGYAAVPPARQVTLRAEAFVAAQGAMTSSAADAMTHVATQLGQGDSDLAKAVRERESLNVRIADLRKRIQASSQVMGSSLEAITQRNSVAALRDEEAGLSRRLETLETQIDQQFPSFAELTRPLPLAAADTQALLNSDEAVILILPAEDATYIWALTRDRFDWARSTLTGDDITAGVRILRRNLDPAPGAPATAFDRKAAYKLYQELLQPLEPVFKDKKVVFIAATGALQSLPFSVLVTAPPQGADTDPAAIAATPWLIDRYGLVTLPAVSSLRSLRCLSAARPHSGCKGAARTGQAPARPTVAYAGLGGPTLSGDDGGSRSAASWVTYFAGQLADPDKLRALSPLPGAAAEIGALAGLFNKRGAFVRTGDQFTETLVKTSPDLKHAAILHFASHALMGGEGGTSGEPGIVMTPPAEGKASALDDGLLTASEAAALDIQASFVVLSACNTARADGTLGAEGLSGLARGFFYAGAKSLMVSHWSVDDQSTRSLMVAMFQNLDRDGANRATALQAAIRSVKAQPRFAEPRFWAPFVLVGEARS